MNTLTLLLIAVGIAGAYAFICNRIAIAVQPIRLEMASRGEEILSSTKISPTARLMIQHDLDTAYSSAMMWVAVFTLPIAMVMVLVDRVRGVEADFGIPEELVKKYERYNKCVWISRAAASPLAAFLCLPFVGWLLLLFVIFSPRKVIAKVRQASAKNDGLLLTFHRHDRKAA